MHHLSAKKDVKINDSVKKNDFEVKKPLYFY